MMMLNQNKQKMYYALLGQEVPVYETDDYGNIKYIDIDGEKVPVESGDTEIGYSEPVEFLGNIAMSGGESEAVEFGLNVGDYQAVLVMAKGEIPIDETSRIWFGSEPKLNPDGTADKYSADYTVIKLSPSQNVDKYVLKAVVK